MAGYANLRGQKVNRPNTVKLVLAMSRRYVQSRRYKTDGADPGFICGGLGVTKIVLIRGNNRQNNREIRMGKGLNSAGLLTRFCST